MAHAGVFPGRVKGDRLRCVRAQWWQPPSCGPWWAVPTQPPAAPHLTSYLSTDTEVFQVEILTLWKSPQCHEVEGTVVLARFMETGLGSVAEGQCLSTPLLPPVKTEPAFPGSPAGKTALPSLPCSWGQLPLAPGIKQKWCGRCPGSVPRSRSGLWGGPWKRLEAPGRRVGWPSATCHIPPRPAGMQGGENRAMWAAALLGV